jgi:hypothetical protein
MIEGKVLVLSLLDFQGIKKQNNFFKRSNLNLGGVTV